MRIKVNPNRMELLRLKKRRVLAQRGHSLLQDKLEELISEFHKLVREFKKSSGGFDKVLSQFLEDCIILKIQASGEELENLLKETAPLNIEIDFKRLLNLRIPRFSFRMEESSYSPKDVPPQWDRVISQRGRVAKALFKMAELYVALEYISKEILKTRRRVNALEYILIPQIVDSIKFIGSKLTDIEREFLSRLMRIKDLIRK